MNKHRNNSKASKTNMQSNSKKYSKRKTVTITWYIRPEDMRILVVPVIIVRAMTALALLALLIPGAGLIWLASTPPLPPSSELACIPDDEPAQDAAQVRPSINAVATIATASSINGDISSPDQPEDAPRRDIDPTVLNHPDSDEVDTSDPEHPTAEETPEPAPPLQALTISRIATELETNGDLTVQFEIRNLSRSVIAGRTWAVATFISQNGSRLLVPSHARILSEQITAEQNKPFGIPFKAKVITAKSFQFEAPPDIDGAFRQVTLIASPNVADGSARDQTLGLNSALPTDTIANIASTNGRHSSAHLLSPIIRTIQIKDY